MKRGWAGSRGWGVSGHSLSSAPPGGSGSLSGASAWASRTGVSDELARAPAAASPSRCTWGPAPCWGYSGSSWGCGGIESFCQAGSSCQTWRSSWESVRRTFSQRRWIGSWCTWGRPGGLGIGRSDWRSGCWRRKSCGSTLSWGSSGLWMEPNWTSSPRCIPDMVTEILLTLCPCWWGRGSPKWPPCSAVRRW